MIIDRDSNHLMKPVVRLTGMNCHISNRADYLMKRKVVHQSPNQEDVGAQQNHCAKEGRRAKERPTSAEKLGPRNKLISKSFILLINIERRLRTRYNF
jgi:hypothetical protein